ncbi:hypothetical protein [Neptunicella marina]|uniref:Uncharacterized protein n=1 Tax=Neptunicella marina TaxID=2125989 RepID=A0A8J6LZY6_9ALTE|nr:hypothetical protein [Neptunicella marina]MBC3764467.1 hypothetical protein [Neptunicella marina]
MAESQPDKITPCRCGGAASGLVAIKGCTDRWMIKCQVPECFAKNTGQGKEDVITGWNRLSTSFYR